MVAKSSKSCDSRPDQWAGRAEQQGHEAATWGGRSGSIETPPLIYQVVTCLLVIGREKVRAIVRVRIRVGARRDSMRVRSSWRRIGWSRGVVSV